MDPSRFQLVQLEVKGGAIYKSEPSIANIMMMVNIFVSDIAALPIHFITNDYTCQRHGQSICGINGMVFKITTYIRLSVIFSNFRVYDKWYTI